MKCGYKMLHVDLFTDLRMLPVDFTRPPLVTDEPTDHLQSSLFCTQGAFHTSFDTGISANPFCLQ